jgi:RNA polymerase sigma-70 factor (ECF subfamily)
MDARKPLREYLPNEESLFALMGQYYDELFRYGIKFTADIEITKDALNQFFIHFWENREKLAVVEHLKAYLFVSYKRWLIHYLQSIKKTHAVAISEDLATELVEQPYEEYLVQQIREAEFSSVLADAIRTLPDRQRELLQLRFYEHLDYDEIALRTSLSLRTVYNKLHEAIKKLRKHSALQRLR